MAESATTPELTGILRIIDEATAPLKKIAEQLRGVGRAAHEAGEKTEHLHHPHVWEGLHENVELLGEHFGELRASIGETNESMGEMLPMLAAFGEAAAMTGLVEMVSKVANARTQLIATAVSLGVTAEQLETLRYTAQMTNVPVETLQSGMGRLEKNMGAAAAGKSKLVTALFEHMNIHLRNAHGAVRSVTDVLPQLAVAFGRTHDKAMLAFAVTSLFGKAGRDLLPMLLAGGPALREFAEQAERINYAFTPQDDENLKEFHRSWLGLADAAEAFENQVGAGLAPILTPIVAGMRDWVTQNRNWMASQIVDSVQQLGHWTRELKSALQGMGWQDSAAGMDGFKQSSLALRAVLIGLMLLLGSPLLIGLASLSRAVLHLGGLMMGFVRIVSAVAGALIGPMVSAIGELVLGLRLGFTAWEAFSLAFAATPLGWVLIAITALGVAAYELWKHWDAIRPMFTALWAWMKGLWSKNVGDIRTICEVLFLPVEEIIQHWTPIKAFFETLWGGVVSVFKLHVAIVLSLVADLMRAIDWIGSSWVGKGLAAAGNFAVGVGQQAVAAAVAPVSTVAAVVNRAMPNLSGTMDSFYGYQPALAGGPDGTATHPADMPLGTPRTAAAIPSPYTAAASPAAAAAAAAPPQHGEVKVSVSFPDGLPQGAAVDAAGSGIAAAPKVDIGQNYPAGRSVGR
ncbi:MAG: phage tail tape measure protein [Janthinobacterium lividum]